MEFRLGVNMSDDVFATLGDGITKLLVLLLMLVRGVASWVPLSSSSSFLLEVLESIACLVGSPHMLSILVLVFMTCFN
jgi:hypothetical protein